MSWRQIIVEGLHWKFRFGKSNVVIRFDNTTFIVGYSELTGRSWGIIERGQYKKTMDGMVTPAHVRAYLLKHRDKWKHHVE